MYRPFKDDEDEVDNGFNEYLLAVFLICCTFCIFNGAVQAGSDARNFSDYQSKIQEIK